MELRTDLAIEAREIAGEEISGVDFKEYSENGLNISRLTVKTDRAGQLLHKEKGTYITVDLPPLTDNFANTDKRLETIGREIRRLLPVNGLALVCGLGNVEITPDALGPKTSAQVLATRHITGELARATGLDRLRPVAVLTTGVTGQTGIETGEYLLSITKKIKPTVIIAIDALASRRLERLGCTLQISNTGISPGAGVGNHRTKINSETMGIPVIAIGVPTVVDTVTMAIDLLDLKNETDANQIKGKLSPDGRKMVVTPKEVDLLIDRASRLISMSVNYALHKGLELEDLAMLV
ncbi:MAG: GPR endopeptidase [Ruminococcus sp.]|nr:GPR endopeptidase [Ruminococcus sp.]